MSVAPHERDAQQDATNERTPHMARKTTTRSANSTDATTNATTASAPLSGFAKGAPALTLADLAARYLTHMAEQGKSEGTRFSYGMELKLAQAELGSDALVSYLTPESIALFNEAPRVTRLKSGRAKSQLSIDKTRRVLRLALTWAHQEGLIDHAVVDPKKDALRADAEGKGGTGAKGKSAKDASATRAKDAKGSKPAKGGKRAARETAEPETISCSVCRATFTPTDEFANTCPDCVKTAEQEAALDAQHAHEPHSVEVMTFRDLAAAFSSHLRGEGTKDETIDSYAAEIEAAAKHFGEDANPIAISQLALDEYFLSPKVMRTSSGSRRTPKAIANTRAAIRMALEWLRATGTPVAALAATEDAPAQEDAPSEQIDATDAHLDAKEEPAAQRAPRASKKRRGAITLEVSQVEAEAAAQSEGTTVA
jgi:hypothetical protein